MEVFKGTFFPLSSPCVCANTKLHHMTVPTHSSFWGRGFLKNVVQLDTRDALKRSVKKCHRKKKKKDFRGLFIRVMIMPFALGPFFYFYSTLTRSLKIYIRGKEEISARRKYRDFSHNSNLPENHI